jgi:hypothetical protein
LSAIRTCDPRWLSSFRAAAGALLVLLGGSMLYACVIEERPFDEQLSKCSEYCREVASKCTGTYAVYDNDEQCLAVCEQVPLGSVEDPPGANTLLCRLDRLHAGSFERALGCPAAGPGGAGICGNDCESFCALRRNACSALQPNDSDIAKERFCEASCPGLAQPPGFSIAGNDATDTLQCRMIQLARALETPAAAEASCVQSQIVPENELSVCSDANDIPIEQDCATYCGLVMTSCTGTFAVYETRPQCEAACSTFARGEHGDITLNTLRCRRYHAYAALDGPEEHCAHAGPTGDGHCADAPQDQGNCVSYCRILRSACGGEYTERFAPASAEDDGSCIQSCTGLPGAGYNGFTLPPRYTALEAPEGDTLKCRTFHAVRALGSPDDPALCAAAFADPGSACE